MLANLYRRNVLSRTLFIWLGFSAALWLIFGIGWITHPQAWGSGVDVQRLTGWNVFGAIIGSNSLLLLLIVAGNLFVRFGTVTPGLFILALQAVIIGWTAGTNAFTEPFSSVAAANAAFLRIGLWETSAYAVLCAVTLPKSLLVSDTFPARRWVSQRTLKDLRFTKGELALAAAGLACLVGAAYVEAFLPI
jgi:hypothetical protein